MPEVVIGEPPIVNPVGTVAATEVTEPTPNDEVAIAVTVLSALIWISLTALGLARVKMFAPTVVAPSVVLATEALVSSSRVLAKAVKVVCPAVPDPVKYGSRSAPEASPASAFSSAS